MHRRSRFIYALILLALLMIDPGQALAHGEGLQQTVDGYAIIPLDVARHVAHNLFHLFAEGKAVWFTFLVLLGQETYARSTPR